MIPDRYIWPASWGLSYRYSYAICISASGLAMVMYYIFRLHLAALNKRHDELENIEGDTENLKKGYRYLL
jgi:hypothetical protein